MYIESIIFNQDFHPFSNGTEFNFKDQSLILLTGDQGCGKSTLLHLIANNDKYTKDIEISSGLLKDISRANRAGSAVTLDEIKNRQFDKLAYKVNYANGVVPQTIMMDTVYHNPQVMNDVNITTERQYNLISQFLKGVYDNKVIPDEYVGNLLDFKNKSKEVGTNYIKDGIPVKEMDVLTSRMKSHGQAMLPLLDEITKQSNSILLIDEPENGLSIRSQYKLIKNIKKAIENNCQIFIATHSLFLIQEFGSVLSLEHKRVMDSNEFINSQK